MLLEIILNGRNCPVKIMHVSFGNAGQLYVRMRFFQLET